MKNKQRIIFLVLFIIMSGILIFRYFNSKDITEKMRNTKDNTAEEIHLKGPKVYIVGDEIKAGYYDIEAKNVVATNAFDIGKNQRILNYAFRKDNEIVLDADSEVLLLPSNFEPIIFHDNIANFKNTTGDFHVGKEIKPGTYCIRVDIDNDDALFLVQVSNLEKDEIKASDTISNKRATNINLKKDELFTIHNMDTKAGDFTVYIEKIK